MPNIVYHVIYCHEGQRFKCKELKLHLSEVCEQLQADPGCMCSEQHCWTRRAATASRWALWGTKIWAASFWWFTVIICFAVLNFNDVTYTTIIPYHPASLLCEVCEGLLATLLKAFITRSEHCVAGLQTVFASQGDGSSIYCHCAAGPCFGLGCT